MNSFEIDVKKMEKMYSKKSILSIIGVGIFIILFGIGFVGSLALSHAFLLTAVFGYAVEIQGGVRNRLLIIVGVTATALGWLCAMIQFGGFQFQKEILLPAVVFVLAFYVSAEASTAIRDFRKGCVK